MKLRCVYCDEEDTKENPIRIWDFTHELVCYVCRVDFLDNEFGFNDEIEVEA